jgi:hypothetical protein
MANHSAFTLPEPQGVSSAKQEERPQDTYIPFARDSRVCCCGRIWNDGHHRCRCSTAWCAAGHACIAHCTCRDCMARGTPAQRYQLTVTELMVLGTPHRR